MATPVQIRRMTRITNIDQGTSTVGELPYKEEPVNPSEEHSPVTSGDESTLYNEPRLELTILSSELDLLWERAEQGDIIYRKAIEAV
jgi:hypothetical protein